MLRVLIRELNCSDLGRIKSEERRATVQSSKYYSLVAETLYGIGHTIGKCTWSFKPRAGNRRAGSTPVYLAMKKPDFESMTKEELIALLKAARNSLIGCEDAADTILDISEILSVDQRANAKNESS